MIIETTNYYPKPGLREAVLVHRQKACALREEMGLPAGQISIRIEGAGPDVRWECRYIDEAAFQADMDTRANSAAFAAHRSAMAAMIERFERNVHRLL